MSGRRPDPGHRRRPPGHRDPDTCTHRADPQAAPDIRVPLPPGVPDPGPLKERRAWQHQDWGWGDADWNFDQWNWDWNDSDWEDWNQDDDDNEDTDWWNSDGDDHGWGSWRRSRHGRHAAQVTGAVNGGGARLKIRTDRGSIHIEEQ